MKLFRHFPKPASLFNPIFEPANAGQHCKTRMPRRMWTRELSLAVPDVEEAESSQKEVDGFVIANDGVSQTQENSRPTLKYNISVQNTTPTKQTTKNTQEKVENMNDP